MKTAVAFIHILFATLWLGSACFYTLLLLPRLSLLDAHGSRLLARSLRRVMVPLLAVSASVTVVSGLVMMVQLHSRHPGSLSHSRWGVALVIGTLASLAALAVAAVIESRLRKADAAAGSDRAASATHWEGSMRLGALALLVLALATMAVARYS